jgi:transcriptional regulator with XRE-family HTH domain
MGLRMATIYAEQRPQMQARMGRKIRMTSMAAAAKPGRVPKKTKIADERYPVAEIRAAVTCAIGGRPLRPLEDAAGLQGNIRKFLEDDNPTHSPGIDVLYKFAKVLGITVSELIGETATQQPGDLAELQRQVAAYGSTLLKIRQAVIQRSLERDQAMEELEELRQALLSRLARLGS